MWQQTSTADMLDLAVDHIRGLQSELQVCKTVDIRDPIVSVRLSETNELAMLF
jgi:hypothetical protein